MDADRSPFMDVFRTACDKNDETCRRALGTFVHDCCDLAFANQAAKHDTFKQITSRRIQPDAGNAMPAVVAGLQQFSKDIRIALGDFAAQSNNRLAIAGGAARLAASAEYTKARQITRVAKVCFLMDALPVQPTNKKQNASFGRFEG